MSGTTPLYSLPYQTLTDQPDGPNLGEDLATAVETQIARLDAANTTQDATATATAAKPIFQGRSTAGQSWGTNSWDDVQINVEDYDTAGGHDTVTNNARYVGKLAGVYRVWGATAFSTNATGHRGARIAKNGTAVDAGGTIVPTVAASFCVVPVGPVYVALNGTTDYVTIQGLCSTASQTAPSTSTVQPFLCVEYVRP